ncbi:MAG: hypothetical protein L6Q71_09350, partial [Planctomycetes bacterium]|nr:hypothetical protein [Planctomycetota bacterium]
MWIKIFLFATPATFLALLCFSVVFVPSTIEVARSDYRIDRLVFSHNGDVNSMNPYLSTTTTDSDVYTHIFESLIDLDEYYRYKYKTARSMRVCEDVVVLLDPDQDPATLRNTLEVALGNDLPDIFDGFRAYDHEEFQSGSPLMYINDGLSAGAAEALAPNYLVFRLRPAPARRLGENEIPTAVDAQIISRIESALEQAGGRSGFAKQYDARHCAARWYMHHNGIADMELPAPLSQEVSKDPATVKAFEEQWTGISKALS